MYKKIDLRFSLVFLFVLMAVLTRLLPHWPNVTAIGAMALFGAAQFKDKKWALFIPFIALFISDLYLNNVIYGMYYEGFVWMATPWVYVGFAAILGVGFLLRGKVKMGHVFGAAVGGSMLFFLITNVGSWIADPIYPKNGAGLLAAYTAGVPFFWNTLLGNVFYSALMFGSFAWMESRYLNLQKA